MELPPDPLATRRELAEARAEILRLKAELDRYQGRQVYYTTSDHLADIIATFDTSDTAPGTVLRATDTGQEFTWEPPAWSQR